MPKQMLEENYIRAFNILQNRFTPINTGECETEKGEIILKSQEPNPERILIKKQLFENLSTEALEVIDLIFNAPREVILSLKTPKQNRITKTRIRKYLIKTWHSELITDLTLKELEEWVKDL